MEKRLTKRIIIALTGIVLIGGIGAAAATQHWFQKGDKQGQNLPVTDIEQQIANNAGVPIALSAVGDVTVTPVKMSARGVDVASEFLVTAKHKMTAAELSAGLFIENEGGFKLTNHDPSKNEFLLTFKHPLENNTIYHMAYNEEGKRPLSFAFQTESAFGVERTTPSDRAFAAPIAGGIEIVLNEQIKGDFKDYFQIEPHVEGTFANVGNTYTFIPKQLIDDSTYTVTIKSGLTAVTGETMDKDYQFSFKTKWKEASETQYETDKPYETFLSGDDVFVDMHVSDKFINNTYDVDIYQLQTPESYMSCYDPDTKTVTIPANTPLLETMRTKSVNPKGETGLSGTQYVSLGKPLPVGYYVIDVKTELDGKTYSAKKCIQSTDLSVYSVSLEGETCFWIHDTKTGAAAEGALLDMDGKTGKTDQNGSTILKNLTEGQSTVTIR